MPNYSLALKFFCCTSEARRDGMRLRFATAMPEQERASEHTAKKFGAAAFAENASRRRRRRGFLPFSFRGAPASLFAGRGATAGGEARRRAGGNPAGCAFVRASGQPAAFLLPVSGRPALARLLCRATAPAERERRRGRAAAAWLPPPSWPRRAALGTWRERRRRLAPAVAAIALLALRWGEGAGRQGAAERRADARPDRATSPAPGTPGGFRGARPGVSRVNSAPPGAGAPHQRRLHRAHCRWLRCGAGEARRGAHEPPAAALATARAA